MKILFDNSKEVALELGPSPLSQVYRSIYKNLQHVTVPYRAWDNPFWLANKSYLELVEDLIQYGELIGVIVDRDKCLNNDQQYYNHLHEIYEKNYAGDQSWLDFHEHIHLCEQSYQKHTIKYLSIDYRNLSGMLERPVDLNWILDSQTRFEPGDVFVSWSELGKSPYTYWANGEPNDLGRLCQLAKPWLRLKPKLLIATESFDLLEGKQLEAFEIWWQRYQSDWCRHWGLTDWSINNMYSGVLLGKISQPEKLLKYLRQNLLIKKVVLQ